MKFLKVALIVLLIVSILMVVSCKNEDEDQDFTISDELLSYEDEFNKDKVNHIRISFMLEDEDEIRELNLGEGEDEASMHKLTEELSGIDIIKLSKKDIRELKEYIDEWEDKLYSTDNKDRHISYSEKEIICEIKTSDTTNWTGSVRMQDKITDRIFIFSTGDIVFKMPNELGNLIPDEVFYRNTEVISGKSESIIKLIETSYFRRYPEQSPTELDIISEEYRAVWKESYQYDSPILINDLKELEEFLNNHPAQSSNEDVLQHNYNDEFFNQNLIYAYVKSEGSGSVNLTVEKAELHGNILKLFMNRTVPDVGTTDMATRVCLFSINREDIKNVKEVEGIILTEKFE